MIDTIFGFFGILMIYGLGLWSGLFVATLMIAGKERDDFEDEISKHRKGQSSER